LDNPVGLIIYEAELKTFCETAVGQYKAPKNIYFLQDLPKGPSGKILRLKLPEVITLPQSGRLDGWEQPQGLPRLKFDICWKI
jgi:acyl-CoA synthetase (AMP-forming)/AMP-acid ligase II